MQVQRRRATGFQENNVVSMDWTEKSLQELLLRAYENSFC